MNKIKRTVIAIMAVVCAFSSTAAISASAKTLEESFSGSVKMVAVDTLPDFTSVWTKEVTAETVGYYKRHYVRAYVGGSSTSAAGSIADTGRRFSNGDITATIQGGRHAGGALQAKIAIPTGYSKYGTN